MTPVASSARGFAAIAADTTNLYFSTDATYALPFAGGSAVPIAPAATALASDGTSLFFATFNPSGAEVIERVPVAGGTPVVLVDGRGIVPGIAVDADNVYWTESGGDPFRGGVAALPKSG